MVLLIVREILGGEGKCIDPRDESGEDISDSVLLMRDIL